MINNIPHYTTKNIVSLNKEEELEYERIKEKIIKTHINNTTINLKDEIIKELKKTSHINTEKIINKLILDTEGYGKINNLLNDDDLEEIMIIGSDKAVYVYHRNLGMMITDIKMTDGEIRQVIEKISNEVQRKIDKQSPLLDARLPDGSRVNATIPPISPDGPTLTIRKFKQNPLTIFDLIKAKTITAHLAAFLWVVIEGLGVSSANIIIAGGTSSGKTTTLNTLSMFIPPHERIITIEDTLELQIPHKHIIRTETRPPNIENKGEINMDVLLKNSLRQRPDKIIVGEVRSKEAITLFTALNTGHSGMGTLHANSTQETITRLNSEPMNVPKIMINSINFIIMQNRIFNKHKGVIRRITEVAEISGMESDNLQLNKIYEYDPKSDKQNYVAISCNFLVKIATLKGWTYKDILDEINERERYLLKSMENDMNDIQVAQNIINKYYVQ